MGDIVVDSSFIIAVLVEEEHSAWSSHVMLELEGENLLAPDLLVWEIASVLQKKVRRGTVSEAQRAIMLARFRDFDVDLRPPPEPMDLISMLETGDRVGLTAYDTAYLMLATDEGAALASLDAALVRAARVEGLTVHSVF